MVRGGTSLRDEREVYWVGKKGEKDSFKGGRRKGKPLA